MLNGLLMLYGDKDRMSGLIYRILHSVLTDEGEYMQGRGRQEWMTVMEAIRIYTGIHISVHVGNAVEKAIRKLDFDRQVAVCDIYSGQHAILLTGRRDGRLEVFDPDWSNVKVRREKAGVYVVRPQDGMSVKQKRMNVIVEEEYFIKAGKGGRGEFQMGAVATRTLVVMTWK